jgi:hypothetical protein
MEQTRRRRADGGARSTDGSASRSAGLLRGREGARTDGRRATQAVRRRRRRRLQAASAVVERVERRSKRGAVETDEAAVEEERRMAGDGGAAGLVRASRAGHAALTPHRTRPAAAPAPLRASSTAGRRPPSGARWRSVTCGPARGALHSPQARIWACWPLGAGGHTPHLDHFVPGPLRYARRLRSLDAESSSIAAPGLRAPCPPSAPHLESDARAMFGQRC